MPVRSMIHSFDVSIIVTVSSSQTWERTASVQNAPRAFDTVTGDLSGLSDPNINLRKRRPGGRRWGCGQWRWHAGIDELRSWARHCPSAPSTRSAESMPEPHDAHAADARSRGDRVDRVLRNGTGARTLVVVVT